MIKIIIFIGAVVVVLRFRTAIKRTPETVEQNRTELLPVPLYYKELLEKYFFYYQKLSSEDKHRFEQKLCYFIAEKEFIPREIHEVPMEMKVFIAAVATQLTFGLPNIYLAHFQKILVYPNRYFSVITGQFHEGEVNSSMGIVALSWSDVAEGFINDKNGFNLGLHEMAHALRLENHIPNEEDNFLDPQLLKQLDDWATCISTNADDKFFRAYAFRNTHEFFAVVVENFFERPEQFRTEYPELYAIIVRLLNQDPITLGSPRAALSS